MTPAADAPPRRQPAAGKLTVTAGDSLDPGAVAEVVAGASAAGAFVTGDPDTGALIKAIIPRVFAAAFANVREMEAAIRASDLSWTRYRVRADYPPPGGRKIRRADVAHFMALALTQDAWLHPPPPSPTSSACQVRVVVDRLAAEKQARRTRAIMGPRWGEVEVPAGPEAALEVGQPQAGFQLAVVAR